MRAIIFANGDLNDAATARSLIQAGDTIIAADGGSRHCRTLNLVPHILIGDFDSIEADELEHWRSQGVQIVQHPARKNYTDLELALRHAQEIGANEILVLASLGARWDQTLANLLLPVSADLHCCCITLVDGKQEIRLIREGDTLELQGTPGDTLSLVPVGGEASGVSTEGLEYPLSAETLYFGGTRGVSNVFLHEIARIHVDQGLLLCVVIHQ
ncbi:MAG: thiamine diphosphokinase [Anaerolineales bacterium]|nr:thiamine diphosphokinase [Anaerolineales bacterium]